MSLNKTQQQKIRQLHLVTQRLMDGPLIGDDVTARRGYGCEFHQIRAYQTGDDVRFIDWRGSARVGKLLVKECLQERNRTVIVALDVSSSSLFGSDEARIDKLREVAAVLLLAAHFARDSVGLVLFADDIVSHIAQKSTPSHVHVLLDAVYTHEPKPGCTTNVEKLCTYIAQQWNKNALVLVVSDFINDNFERAMRAAVHRTDIVAVRVIDCVEREQSVSGLVTLQDLETGQMALAHVGARTMNRVLGERINEQDALFARNGVDVVDVNPEQDTCAVLVEFFKRRMIHAAVRAG